jgi:hypothetical protein
MALVPPPATAIMLKKKGTLALELEEPKYALESWRYTPAIARFPKAQLFHCSV